MKIVKPNKPNKNYLTEELPKYDQINYIRWTEEFFFG